MSTPAFDLTPEERVRRNALIRQLLAQLEAHASGERGHAQRVAVYAVATGQALGMGDEELLNLRYAAELHDIGKLRVPSELLNAMRPLEAFERALVERHSVWAEEVLPNEPFLNELLPAIRAHHERWSGGGYPDQLSGGDIPLAARIIGPCEALDVMLSGGPGRPAFPEEAALSALSGLSGAWFDPAVASALLRVQKLIQPLHESTP